MEAPKTVEELSINYTLEGQLVTKELEKEVLTKGAWSTVMYLYQDLNKKTGEYGPPKVRVQRYQKQKGEYKSKTKFNISSNAQAQKVVDVLQKWLKDPRFQGAESTEDED